MKSEPGTDIHRFRRFVHCKLRNLEYPSSLNLWLFKMWNDKPPKFYRYGE